MRRIAVIIIFLALAALCVAPLLAQTGPADIQFVLVTEFGDNEVLTDSTWRVSCEHPFSQLGQGYLPTQIDSAFLVFDAYGRRYRVLENESSTFGTSVLVVVELQDQNLAPSGVGVIYEKPAENDLILIDVAGDSGLSPATIAKIHLHNALNTGTGNGATDGNGVYSGGTTQPVPDTTDALTAAGAGIEWRSDDLKLYGDIFLTDNTFVQGILDLGANRIQNVADPILTGDAVNLQSLRSEISDSNAVKIDSVTVHTAADNSWAIVSGWIEGIAYPADTLWLTDYNADSLKAEALATVAPTVVFGQNGISGDVERFGIDGVATAQKFLRITDASDGLEYFDFGEGQYINNVNDTCDLTGWLNVVQARVTDAKGSNLYVTIPTAASAYRGRTLVLTGEDASASYDIYITTSTSWPFFDPSGTVDGDTIQVNDQTLTFVCEDISSGGWRWVLTSRFPEEVTSAKLTDSLNLFRKTIADSAPTGSTDTLDLASRYVGIYQIDLTSASSPLTLTVQNPIEGGVYTFHWLNASSNDIVYPATFYDESATTLGTVSYAAPKFITCYFDGSNFYCK